MNLDLQPGEIQSEEDMEICGSSEDELPRGDREIYASSLSGTKRPRLTVDEEEPLVRISYKSLTRESKRKLTELLLEWSQWHTHHCSPSTDSSKVLESGEDTFSPAIQVGADKSHALSFWMENETHDYTKKELISLDENLVPNYDRGFSLALTSNDGSNNMGLLEVGEGSRCFNCGSYNHALKKCPKPRDNVVVNNARKQHVSRRNQNANSRKPIRYYQNTPGGKFDGLKPGNLDSETRQFLGLGELDPPPWLNRIREIGYPPGYLDVKEEDQSSGIIIFGDDKNVEDSEDGEILERNLDETVKRMSVKFPGVNAHIPKNADEKLWAARRSDRDRSSSKYNPATDRGSRYNHTAKYFSRSRFHNHDQIPPRVLGDEPSPPDRDNERCRFTNPRRYGDYDLAYYFLSRRDGGSRFGNDSLTHYSHRY